LAWKILTTAVHVNSATALTAFAVHMIQCNHNAYYSIWLGLGLELHWVLYILISLFATQCNKQTEEKNTEINYTEQCVSNAQRSNVHIQS